MLLKLIRYFKRYFLDLKSTDADEFDFGIMMEEIDDTSILEENNSPSSKKYYFLNLV